MVKDDKLDIWGCCEDHDNRADVTANIAASTLTTVKFTAIQQYVITISVWIIINVFYF